ncbi:MAG: hypothetical protein JSW73_01215 [Candidatus Woesearchaeota archaeon]|nr:MAG: hypothetical protein JSW73_01215 [Candidatus Woesearchaeota archaeon]
MAWFHKSLKDMKVAIEKEDWKEVIKILKQHNSPREDRRIRSDIGEISHTISDYREHIQQIYAAIYQYAEGKRTYVEKYEKDHMLLKVNAAIRCALKFEEVIKHLIKEGKFLE